MRSILILFLLWAAPLNAAPKAKLIPLWNSSVENDQRAINHGDWDIFLKRNTQLKGGITVVSYGSVSPKDRTLLKGYLSYLQQLSIRSYSRREQLTFWINLYNAKTVDLVLDTYPVDSIRRIPKGLLPLGPWDKKVLTVEGRNLSLNDIEHGILRPIWKDYRIHFLVNCASIGCPNLQGQALTADNYDETAHRAAMEYIDHPRALRKQGNGIILSSLFDWYVEDFGGKSLKNIQKYLSPLKKSLLENPEFIRYEYDWNLNEEKNIPKG